MLPVANILIVEDEKGINELISRTLKMTGHNSFQAYAGLEALDVLNNQNLDLVLLDINLPDISGFSLIERFKNIPVIYVTARDQIKDRIRGLSGGAEDYIIKPFDMEELIARVHVVLRRSRKEEGLINIADVQINIDKRIVIKGNKVINLTSQEYELLEALAINRNIALSREKLLDIAWGMDYYGDFRTVDVHIRRLRKKLELENNIKTVFKYGYRLEL